MNGIAPDLPVWAQWFAALAVPIAAIVGVGLGILNYTMATKKRHDELYDRRFEFYVSCQKTIFEKLRECQNMTDHDAFESMHNLLDEWAQKSRFLFPEMVRDDLLALRNFGFNEWLLRFDMSERPIDEIFLKHMKFRP